jgi:hypothetical protein
MGPEIIFNVEKPVNPNELEDFRLLKKEVKSLLKMGKLKVVEKFSVFALIITGYTTDEKNKVTALFKENRKIKLIS